MAISIMIDHDFDIGGDDIDDMRSIAILISRVVVVIISSTIDHDFDIDDGGDDADDDRS